LVATSVAYVCDRLVLKYNNTGNTGTRADNSVVRNDKKNLK